MTKNIQDVLGRGEHLDSNYYYLFNYIFNNYIFNNIFNNYIFNNIYLLRDEYSFKYIIFWI